MSRLLWVCLGGAIGTGARFLISGWTLSKFGTAFPWGTLAVNALGSFLLGFLMQIGTTSEVMSPALRLALTTGAMGGFTTYSTFNYETLNYLQQNAWLIGLANIFGTVFLCLGMGLAGLFAGRVLLPH